MATYSFRCTAGHAFDRELTKSQFVELDHRCPTCGKPAKRAPIAVPGGVAKCGRDRQYPYRNVSLPHKYDANGKIRSDSQIIRSAAHENDVCAGAYNGERWEKNQI